MRKLVPAGRKGRCAFTLALISASTLVLVLLAVIGAPAQVATPAEEPEHPALADAFRRLAELEPAGRFALVYIALALGLIAAWACWKAWVRSQFRADLSEWASQVALDFEETCRDSRAQSEESGCGRLRTRVRLLFELAVFVYSESLDFARRFLAPVAQRSKKAHGIKKKPDKKASKDDRKTGDDAGVESGD